MAPDAAIATLGAGSVTPPGRGPAGVPGAASPATTAARRLVGERLPLARDLGTRLAEEIDDPAAFVAQARESLAALADPAYRAGQRLVAPGIGPTLGVRTPLLEALAAGLRRGLRGIRSGRILVPADALAREEIRELRWLAIHLLRWVLPEDPERGWQVLRRIGRDADDWITVDTLAVAAAEGVVREPYRWAELEQLVFSPITWERRLVGSTVAAVVHIGPRLGQIDEVAPRGLELVRQLIGDAAPEVQKSLAWALRELAKVEPTTVAAFCRAEAERAVAGADGHRAWVLRDTLSKLPAADAAAIRVRLAGIRRQAGAPSTSVAAATAAAFASAGLGRPLPEVPLT